MLRPDGKELTDEEWGQCRQHIAVLLAGNALNEYDAHGQRVVGNTLLILMKLAPRTGPVHSANG